MSKLPQRPMSYFYDLKPILLLIFSAILSMLFCAMHSQNTKNSVFVFKLKDKQFWDVLTLIFGTGGNNLLIVKAWKIDK